MWLGCWKWSVQVLRRSKMKNIMSYIAPPFLLREIRLSFKNWRWEKAYFGKMKRWKIGEGFRVLSLWPNQLLILCGQSFNSTDMFGFWFVCVTGKSSAMDVTMFCLYSQHKDLLFTFSTSRLVSFSYHSYVAGFKMNKPIGIQMKEKLCFHRNAF